VDEMGATCRTHWGEEEKQIKISVGKKLHGRDDMGDLSIKIRGAQIVQKCMSQSKNF
jgi:hypothetical protein